MLIHILVSHFLIFIRFSAIITGLEVRLVVDYSAVRGSIPVIKNIKSSDYNLLSTNEKIPF